MQVFRLRSPRWDVVNIDIKDPLVWNNQFGEPCFFLSLAARYTYKIKVSIGVPSRLYPLLEFPVAHENDLVSGLINNPCGRGEVSWIKVISKGATRNIAEKLPCLTSHLLLTNFSPVKLFE